MSFPPRGVIGACLTPFAPDGGVDGDALRQEIDFMAGHCVAVSVLGAEVSEYRMLDEAARRHWLRHGVELVGGRVPVVAGASSPRLDEVAELAELAASAGADFVQVLIPRRPSGDQAGTAELVAYYGEVSERSPVPVVAYHNPTYGSDPTPDTMVRLCELDGVVGVKESSRDMSRIGRLIAEIDAAGLARYYTTMQPLLATVLQGGSGAMMPAPATLLGERVVRAVEAGDLAAATAAQEAFSRFPSRWRSYGLPPVMRCAMAYLGLDVGPGPAPYVEVGEPDAAEIAVTLAAAGLTRDSLVART
ncbi:MAG: dihydrodipicolinate synthase family protein [Streptosporangiales bacterium]|nr:dihydrodipicolinate synthase family protein [Streptosporangiales bacterium]MBO0889303.1 dihydrodipicolinate synthase family protein [Acidothermales bacterium]